MSTVAARHLARLLGLPATASLTLNLAAAAGAAEPTRVATALVDEALASDDVTSVAAARAFVTEQITEWEEFLEATLQHAIEEAAFALIEKRAPDA